MPQIIEPLPYILRFVAASPPSNFIHNWEVLNMEGQCIFKIVTNLPQKNGYNHVVKPMPVTHFCSKRGVFAQIDWHDPSGTSIRIGRFEDIACTARLPPETAQALVVPAPSRWQLLSNWAKCLVRDPKGETW
ncbi:hypothetical protein VKT23_000281 [Stygiomarasmius scandens]|uniref:Uncharacterized protein n=1 Tax=Marasmiellus scandens TaxID=2682957 RepID=A0ABR1K6B0_9AGAR